MSGQLLDCISLMSAPAAKAFSEPVNTIAPIAASASNAANAAPSSRTSGVDSALRTFGRFSVISPTDSRVSTMMFS